MASSKILVDGNCVVCSWEISKYKRMAPQDFDLIDISDQAFDAAGYGFTAKAVNRRMHVLGPDGEVFVGVPAFAHIWSRIPKLRWASRAVRWPGIKHLAAVGYEGFALVRPWLPKKNKA